MSLPSLNLSFEKHTATSMASTNDNSAKNSVVLNIINPLNGGEMIERPPSSRPPSISRVLTRRMTAISEVEVETYKSPSFDDVEKEFKD